MRERMLVVLVLLFLTCVNAGGNKQKTECCCESKLCRRTIAQVTRKYDATNNPLAILDAYGRRAIATGYYTNASIYRLYATATNYLEKAFNVKVTNIAGPYPDTLYVLDASNRTVGLSVPYANGESTLFKVQSDTSDCRAAKTGKKFFMNFGKLILFLTSGNVTDSQGRVQRYNANDIIFYFENWMTYTNSTVGGRGDKGELMLIQTEFVTQAVTSSLGEPEQHSKIRIYTAVDGWGYGVLGITVNPVVVNGAPAKEQINRGLYTWGDC